ncbi:MAG: Bacterial alpha-L-rhamnosidase [Candidatus Lokiarchaeota archaeon]|nr:Bacterial alpha-L-rhamnosidase [Candidatus Lokiarchaeota archaeon]
MEKQNNEFGKIRPKTLRCEYLINPLGIDVLKPRFSWIFESKECNQKQTSYHILVSSNGNLLKKNEGDIWDSGKVNSEKNVNIKYDGKPLESRKMYYWKLKVWDRDGNPSEWSKISKWSMGLLKSSDWKAEWIGARPKRLKWLRKKIPKRLEPCYMLRKSFFIEEKVKNALVYISALGEYELYINGKKVGDRYLAPEWTVYDKRVQYQTYDISDFLNIGQNVIGVILADGWYAGHIGLTLLYNHSVYGFDRRLILQLPIVFADDTKIEILSNSSWKIYKDGPIRRADHFKGETYDLRKELLGWSTPNFDDSDWENVHVERKKVKLVAQMNEPIRIVDQIKPIEITEPKPGIFIYNLGQNIAGWCKIKLNSTICDQEAIIRLRYGEMLKENGSLYTRNLKTARATDKYIFAGDEERELHPHFTYHGFQYVEVSGLKEGIKPPLEFITGCAIASDTPVVGSFECSDRSINKLWSNIIWSQRGNLISVPTDCPQRDERLGWMGDAQVFCQTSMYNMDMAAFYNKWIKDIRDDQTKNGRYPDIAPNTRKNKKIIRLIGAPAWADCGVILPWKVYLNYNDRRIIKEHYTSAKKWVDFVHSKNPDLIWRHYRGRDYSDWLNGNKIKAKSYPKRDASIPKIVFATLFFYNSTILISKMAKILENSNDFHYYKDLAANIKEKFNNQFVSTDGIVHGNTQAGYALALYFNILDKETQTKSIQNMIKALERYDNRLSTGFVSTLPLMLELTRSGNNDIAYELLFSRKFPSWFYMIDQGATTMWERWDGYVKGRGFQSWIMNSFNHYAYGSVGEWIYRIILGLNLLEENPGFSKFIINPQPGSHLKWAKGSYKSIRGEISISWKIKNNIYSLKVEIPCNTTAIVNILADKIDSIKENGTPIEDLKNIKFLSYDDNIAKYEISSGEYKFQSSWRKNMK